MTQRPRNWLESNTQQTDLIWKAKCCSTHLWLRNSSLGIPSWELEILNRMPFFVCLPYLLDWPWIYTWSDKGQEVLVLIDRSFLLDYGCLLKENLPFEKPPLKDLKLQENHSFLSKQKVVLASVSSCMLASLLSPLFPNVCTTQIPKSLISCHRKCKVVLLSSYIS